MVWSIAVIAGALINIFTSSSFDIIVTFMVSGFLYYIFNISLNTHRKKAKNEKFIREYKQINSQKGFGDRQCCY